MATMTQVQRQELIESLSYLRLPEDEKLNGLLCRNRIWNPLPGPQTLGYHCQVDECESGEFDD